MGNLFVEDSEIRVAKSPFSAYPGEVKVYDGRLKKLDEWYVLTAVNRGDITGIDFEIMEAVAELEFATSRMVTQYLNLKNINAEQGAVSNRLKYMTKLTLLTRFKIIKDYKDSEDSIDKTEYDEENELDVEEKADSKDVNTRYFCLDIRGNKLLRSREKEPVWMSTDNTRPIDIMKRILARNQVLLTLRKNLNNVEKYVKNPKLRNIFNETVRSDLSVTLKNASGNSEGLIFEIVRNYDGCMERALDHLAILNTYIENFSPMPNLLTPPKVIVVGEDDRHLFEIYKNMIARKISPSFVSFTSDLRLISKELSQSLIQFNIVLHEGKNKPKITELDFELFKGI